MEKQERYLIDSTDDLIDKWARDKTHDEFRVIMWAMIEKYQCRLGKKAPTHEETEKMADYMSRWNQYEWEWSDEK